ncbi:MAG: LemA family protein [Gammaproteobacteria bacterium]|nr:LemA family protein [Gammaproteobacteria bacterium]
MAITKYFFWSLMLAVFIYAVVLYNHLVMLKHNVAKAWANIDILLKQRHDELPKLVEVCKRYMQHERQTLDSVMQARAQSFKASEEKNINAFGSAEAALRTSVGQLFAVAENYPELKADQLFRNLSQRISALENQIADRREYYNDSVNLNNVRIEQFPDIIIARLTGFREKPLLEFEQSELSDVDIKKIFSEN